jgi:hypothetical protein
VRAGESVATRSPPDQRDKAVAVPARSAHRDRDQPHWLGRILGGMALALAAGLVAHYPIGTAALATGLALYGMALYRWPALWLAVLPAALPVLDFADRTGWSLLDEFDLLLLLTLAVLLLRTPWPGWSDRHSRGFAFVLAVFGGILAISLARGLWPWEPWGPNAGFSYLSQYHALRVGKGLVFGLLFWPWARSALARSPRNRELLVTGILVGLALTCCAMVIERGSFVGLFDFSTGYRATAFFTSVNNGGGSIDAYLLLALPSVAACWLLWRSPLVRLAGLVLFTVALYCVLVTFTRIDYLAVAMIGAILLAALSRAALSARTFFTIALPITAIAALLAVVASGGSFTQQRFAAAGTDLRSRIDEAARDLMLSQPGIGTLLFGNGLGSFPRRQYLSAPPGLSPAAFSIAEAEDNRFLRLGYGTPVFILQRLDRPLPDRVTVRTRLRGAAAGVGLGVSVCEKSLLYSFRCEARTRLVDPSGADGWIDWTSDLDLRGLRHRAQPVYFSLYHVGDTDEVIDADDVSMVDDHGRELLANGGFSAGGSRWFFTSDDHLNWRIDNLWLHAWFEQGLFGTMALAAVMIAGLGAAIRGFRERTPLAAIALASLAAFATVGLTESLIEAARIGFLLLLTVYLAVCPRQATKPFG